MKQEQMIGMLHGMADRVGENMEKFDGAFVCMRVTLKELDEDGNRIRLVCGIETVDQPDNAES